MGQSRKRGQASAYSWESCFWRYALTTAGVLLVAALVSYLFDSLGFSDANLIMSFIFGVVVVSVRTNRFWGVFASITSVFLFNFLFTAPRLTFTVNDTQYIITFSIMMAVSLIISALTVKERIQAVQAAEREHRSSLLYQMSRSLLNASGIRSIYRIGLSQAADVVSSIPFIVLISKNGEISEAITLPHRNLPAPIPWEDWTGRICQTAASGKSLPLEDSGSSRARGLLIPLAGAEGAYGVLGFYSPYQNGPDAVSKEDLSLLETFAAQISLALDREKALTRHEKEKVSSEKEKLRFTILRSISHDLRTPLAGITGASSTLLANQGKLEDKTQRDLLTNIYEEANWLTGLVENILSLSKIQSTGGVIKKSPEVLDDILYAAAHRIRSRYPDRSIQLNLPEEVSLVPMDGMLIEQVLINLLENSVRHTPEETAITLSAQSREQGENDRVEITVKDNGPGLREEILGSLFDLFKESNPKNPPKKRGAGLGLGICRAIVQAHGGEIHAENRPQGGTAVTFNLPNNSPREER